METLFYSPKEKLLFLIPSYYVDGLGEINNLIENLQKHQKELQPYTTNPVYTQEILVSRRYKYMRSFHTQTDTIPPEAFVIGEDWTMHKWITD